MCIIVVKEKGIEIPKKEILKNCYDSNSDGVGYMFASKNKVIIRKGFLTFDSFYSDFQIQAKRHENFENTGVIIHFRISTSGGIHGENTHPFAITSNYDDLKKQKVKCNLGVAHNGIISNFTPTKKEQDLFINDTMKFIKYFLAPLKKQFNGFYKNSQVLQMINSYSNSKFAFLDSNGNVFKSGDFIKDERPLFFKWYL